MKPHSTAYRKPNDGKTLETAKRLCVFCLLNECKNKSNDMLHLNSQVSVNANFINFLHKAKDGQPVRTTPIGHKFPENWNVEKVNISKKIPCKFCLLGECKEYTSDTSFHHIYGWYCPLNQKQIEMLVSVYDQKERADRENQKKQLALLLNSAKISIKDVGKDEDEIEPITTISEFMKFSNSLNFPTHVEKTPEILPQVQKLGME